MQERPQPHEQQSGAFAVEQTSRVEELSESLSNLRASLQLYLYFPEVEACYSADEPLLTEAHRDLFYSSLRTIAREFARASDLASGLSDQELEKISLPSAGELKQIFQACADYWQVNAFRSIDPSIVAKYEGKSLLFAKNITDETFQLTAETSEFIPFTEVQLFIHRILSAKQAQ